MEACCFVIPVYRHGAALPGVLERLEGFGLPAIVVDDGNDEGNRRRIRSAVERSRNAVLLTREENGGKGAAVAAGIRKAAGLGFSHVFQVDADGQHDVSAVPRFLALSRRHPEAVICGCPEYDGSAPRSRVRGRRFANGWFHAVTLSDAIPDAMVGFRIYPVGPAVSVLDRTPGLARGMGFDIEILVRLVWENVPVVPEPVKISYPEGGISNFRMFKDNAAIAGTYTRLCLGMIPRLPRLVSNAAKRR